MSTLKGNTLKTCVERFRLFLNVAVILEHFLLRKTKQLVSYKAHNDLMKNFGLVCKKKCSITVQPVCCSLKGEICREPESSCLFLGACTILTKKKKSFSFSTCYLMRKNNGMAISSDRNSFSSPHLKILSQNHFLFGRAETCMN